jgi:hypothetical protein
MTPAQQDNLWHKYNAFRKRKATQFVPVVYKALKAQLQFFKENRNLDLLPMQPVADAVKSIYLDAGRLWAHESYLNVMRQAGLRKSFFVTMQYKARMPIGFNEDFINSILQYFELRLLNDAVLPITQTTRDWILQSLNKGIEEGLGIDEIVQQIMRSDITRVRANTIARTEIGKAANYGADLGAEKTGLLFNDVWISVRDHRTRRDHRDADNQVVPHGEPFVVGAERYLMLRPGDSKSQDGRKVPAKEVVNCRCVKGHRPIRGANGLPLRA